jgi:hypothetical protein
MAGVAHKSRQEKFVVSTGQGRMFELSDALEDASENRYREVLGSPNIRWDNHLT